MRPGYAGASWSLTPAAALQVAQAAQVEKATGRRSYDQQPCDHGCCPAEVCAFVEDCHTHERRSA